MTMTAIDRPHTKQKNESPIDALYVRLAEAGFDRTFVRNYILPDWWEDSLAHNPATFGLAELAIARMLGFSIQSLRNPLLSLRQEMQIGYRLKRDRDVREEDLTAAIALAQAVGNTLAATLGNVPPFWGGVTAEQMRQEILHKHSAVDLFGLLEWAWAHGIVVAHLQHLPNQSKKFDGIALFCAETPVVILASCRDSAPWLAYHLAHELGHIMQRHVAPGTVALLDSNIGRRLTLDDLSINPTYEPDEVSADQYAMSLLTGRPTMSFAAVYGMTADKLAAEARRVERSSQINAGTLALIYGRSAARMGVAQNALKVLGLVEGAQQQIRAALAHHLPEDRPEALTSALLLLGWD